MKITFPAENVVLMGTAGTEENGKLTVKATVMGEVWRAVELAALPDGAGCPPVYRPAAFHAGYHAASVTLEKGRNTVFARDRVSGETQQQTVFYAPDAMMKYRFTLDDNIWCFQDLAKNAGVYRSLFDNPWFGLLRRMHERYGTKFHLNIYRQCPEHGGFDLSMMPERYKDEFRASADWMRMSFHADANLPDHPYLFSSYEQFYRECAWVNEQILRFAGEESLARTSTTVHWGDGTKDVVRAARDLGMRLLIGSGLEGTPTNNTISYHLNPRQCALLRIYGMIYDEETDMFFQRGGASIQRAPLDEIEQDTIRWEKEFPLLRFRGLCLHEEYFYPDYVNYMPDYPARFETAIRSVTAHGYKPAFPADVGLF